IDMTSPPSSFATAMARAVLPVAVAPVMTRASAMPAEAALQLFEREADDRRAAVHVVVWQLGREEALEERFHFLSRERLARLDGGLARERHRHPLVLVARGAREVAARGELRDHFAQAALRVEPGMRIRCGAHDDAARTERLDFEACALEQ